MCLSPLTLNREGLLCQVRCGQCRPCRIRRKQAWVGRLRLELRDHPASRFLTLNYSDELRPTVHEVAHLRDFMKRYRYHYGPCRFFAVGEYDKSDKAHWHLIIFGHAPIPAAIRNVKRGAHWYDNKAWEWGFSHDGNVTTASIGYVAGYAVKGLDAPADRQPVVRQSLKPGIGFNGISTLARACASAPLTQWPSSYTVGGRRYPLSDGALARFQVSYLESGGVPPPSQTPDALDFSARLVLGDMGTRIRQQEIAANRWRRDHGDEHGITEKTRS